MDSDVVGARLAQSRREFLGWASRRGVGLGLLGASAPALLAACAADDPAVTSETRPSSTSGDPATTTTRAEATEKARAIIGDVVDFSLTPDGWAGDFGFVTLAVHKGVFGGHDVYFIRTDTSDQAFATAETLVWVPKLAGLAGDGTSGVAYVFSNGADGQVTVFSNEPGQPGYTPAWTMHRATWSGDPRVLRSVAEVTEARSAGALSVQPTSIVVNAEIIKWSAGELPVDTERTVYLGPGQLLEPVDTSAMRATFKLNQCFPASRYFATSHSLAGPATETNTILCDGLQAVATRAGATGRTNVLMNGLEGPGPMGFQPSAFDFDAGNPAWSPYWDHYSYRWHDGVTARKLETMTAIHAARDAGDLTEFPGVPATEGTVFTVNCPVPVLAPVTWTP